MTGRPPFPPEQRKRREHGTNARYRWGETGNDYRNGCRCFECSSAGVLYEKLRASRKARGWNPYVDTTEAREHLLWLRSQGVGRRAVAAASGVALSSVQGIASGKIQKARPETVAKLLAVHTATAKGGARIDGTRAFAQVDELTRLGYSERNLARRLGYAGTGLQLKRASGVITRAKAERIEALYLELTAERDAQREWDAARQADYRARKETGDVVPRKRSA